MTDPRQTRMIGLPRTAPTLIVALVAALLAVGLGGCGTAGVPPASTARAAAAVPRSATTPQTTTTTGPSTTQEPAPPTSSDAVTYGLADATGMFASCQPGDPDCCDTQAGRCELSHMTGYFDDRLFLDLLTPASAHRVRDVRLFVPYDAVAEWNGSTTAPGCEYSSVRQQGWSDAVGPQPAGEAIDQLVAGVIEARSEGLEPMVSIVGYPWSTLRPAGDAAFPDPTTLGGYWEYRCGLQGIVSELSRLPAWEQPHVWEPVNEPETFPIFDGPSTPPANQCTVGAVPAPDGPGKAACDEAIATSVIQGFAGHAHDTVLAGTFEHPDVGYLAGYVAELQRLMPGARFPAIWSVHDYPEVTDAYAGHGAPALARFDEALAQDTDGAAHQLWITESATVLTSPLRGGHCPAVGIDPAGSIGACVSGQPERQLASVEGFFALPHAASAVPITHLFWYQFKAAPQWDSGLLDPDGQPRTAYCVFYGHGTCTGDPDAD